jgi:hypothetical protein
MQWTYVHQREETEPRDRPCRRQALRAEAKVAGITQRIDAEIRVVRRPTNVGQERQADHLLEWVARQVREAP